LCFDHHTAFDASNSQDKNYTAKEIEIARNRLYERVASRNGRLSIDLKFRPDGFTLSYEPKQVSPAQLKAVVAAMSDYYEKLGGGGLILDQDGTRKEDSDA
jgi:hypothetical protein